MPINDTSRPPLTLRLAITGHRKFGEGHIQKVIQEKIKSAILLCAEGLELTGIECPQFFSSDPDLPPTLTLISGLAQGADQMAVAAFREAPLSVNLTRRVEVIIPFAIDDYARTMSGASAARMKEIIGDSATGDSQRADRVTILADRRLGQQLEETEERRFIELRYAALADILVRQADVLITVWDGKGKKGVGTSHVTALALRQGLPVLWIDARDGSLKSMAPGTPYGDLLHGARENALTLEKSPEQNNSDARKAFFLAIKSILEPNNLAAPIGAGIDQVPNRLFNSSSLESRLSVGSEIREVAKNRTWFTHYKHLLWLSGSDIRSDSHSIQKLDWKHERSWPISQLRIFSVECDFVRTELQNGRPPEAHGLPLVRLIGEPWAQADALATRLGHLYRSNYSHIFISGALAVLSALFGGLHPEYKTLFLSIELAFLLYASTLYWLSAKYRIHDRFLDARGIAEELRVTWATAQLGLGGRRMSNKLVPRAVWATQAWIANVGLPDVKLDQDELLRISKEIRKFILLDQKKYHTDNAIRMGLFHRALEKCGFAAFTIAFVTGAIFLIATGLFHVHPGDNFSKLVIFIGVGLPAVAAALAGIRYQGDFHRLSERAEKTVCELERIKDAMLLFERKLQSGVASFDGFSELRDIILDLGISLKTNLDDWRFVYRARPAPEPG